jgi:hypothetical protein
VSHDLENELVGRLTTCLLTALHGTRVEWSKPAVNTLRVKVSIMSDEQPYTELSTEVHIDVGQWYTLRLGAREAFLRRKFDYVFSELQSAKWKEQ